MSDMWAQLLGLLLLACQIISNRSYEIHPVTDFIPTIRAELVEPATLPEGYVSFPYDHVAYKVHLKPVTWNQARDRCIAEGAYLAIADTVDKIKHICSTQSQVTNWISVGIRFSETTNNWVRIDSGLHLTSLPWQVHNPDDAGNCVCISLSGDALVNCSCDWSFNWYVCEIPI